jgi:hypothetical protein
MASAMTERRLRGMLLATLVAVAACSSAATPSPGGSSAARTGIAGRASAGPVCPVEQVPPNPSCADRPVPGAAIVVRDASGARVATATTAPDGTFFVETPPGDFTVEPAAVAGLMGTAAPQHVTVSAGATSTVELSYDTGIRAPAALPS